VTPDPVDLLFFGPHPDDIEIGVGSNGTVDERLAEAEAARAVLGARWRVNLRWPDRAIGDPEHVRQAAALIRAARPRAIAVPHWSDRHPDHVAASRVLTEAVFSAGLRRYQAVGEAWKADWICYYFINDSSTPSFVVDVSPYYETKRRALACHVSQFAPDAGDSVSTRLTTPRFQQLIESRDAQFGAVAGVAYAEGFIVRDPVVRESLFKTC
jgi:bacillithiol biosynthesis deacetylase BshB1